MHLISIWLYRKINPREVYLYDSNKLIEFSHTLHQQSPEAERLCRTTELVVRVLIFKFSKFHHFKETIRNAVIMDGMC